MLNGNLHSLHHCHAYADAGDGNKASAAALRARLMGNKQPSMVLGPKPDSAQEPKGHESRAQSVQLSAVDSKGRAVPGAFGRAAVGAGAPEGGRKPKRVCTAVLLPCLTSDFSVTAGVLLYTRS